MIIMPEDKNIIALLPPNDAQLLLLALFSEDDNIPELSPIALMAYTVIKAKSDRISKIKSENGKKGGRPSKNQVNAEEAAESKVYQEKPNETYDNLTEAKKASVTHTVTQSVAQSETDTVTEAKEKPARTRAKPPAAAQDILRNLDPRVQEAFREFINSRAKLRKAMTPHAMALALKRLRELAGDDPDKQIAHIDKAVERGWLSFYPLNDTVASGPGHNNPPSFADLYHQDFGEEVPNFGS